MSDLQERIRKTRWLNRLEALLGSRGRTLSPIPVAIGIAAGVIVGFFLGAMFTRHGESAVVILNATNGPLHRVTVTTDLGLTGWWPFRVPEIASYNFELELQPDTVSLVRLSSHRPTALSVRATTANGKKLSSDQVYISYQGVVFALVSSDSITLQYTTKEMWSFRRHIVFAEILSARFAGESRF